MGLQERIEVLVKAEPAHTGDFEVWSVWHKWYSFAQDYAQKNPEPGMPATMHLGSDSYPYTITRVGKGRVWAKRDKVRALKGNEGENQRYLYLTDASAPEEMFAWSEKHQGYGKGKSSRLYIGRRRAYSDPSF